MSRLPVSLAEADALTYARRLVAAVRDGKLALGGIEHGHWFDKDESRRKDESERASRNEFKRWATADAANMIAAVQLASAGYRLPYDALVDLILDCRDRNVSVASVSIYLAGFDMDITAGRKFRKKSGPDKSEYIMRDLCIGYVVFSVSNRFGFKPTRNPAARRRPSACSIVTEAFGP